MGKPNKRKNEEGEEKRKDKKSRKGLMALRTRAKTPEAASPVEEHSGMAHDQIIMAAKISPLSLRANFFSLIRINENRAISKPSAIKRLLKFAVSLKKRRTAPVPNERSGGNCKNSDKDSELGNQLKAIKKMLAEMKLSVRTKNRRKCHRARKPLHPIRNNRGNHR